MILPIKTQFIGDFPAMLKKPSVVIRFPTVFLCKTSKNGSRMFQIKTLGL